ncbi:hypothetical protein CcarbDRAFT_3785 [Clostridium carboxidivorans P7]|uniref:Uncharacterized protein n=1 Tax=Clostridium carboxidivorans P7 TaxID=536227 RepID=C6PYB8_9CLOT|nr:hypothetical protein [Clostridium carboxidivorans]EET85739.1 hypothetical protein CcarbDRAFT_3785 [Clostridium carboxidivorans P7]
MNKVEKRDLQRDFKKSHNKPGSYPTPEEEGRAIKKDRNSVRTTD